MLTEQTCSKLAINIPGDNYDSNLRNYLKPGQQIKAKAIKDISGIIIIYIYINMFFVCSIHSARRRADKYWCMVTELQKGFVK